MHPGVSFDSNRRTRSDGGPLRVLGDKDSSEVRLVGLDSVELDMMYECEDVY